MQLGGKATAWPGNRKGKKKRPRRSWGQFPLCQRPFIAFLGVLFTPIRLGGGVDRIRFALHGPYERAAETTLQP